MQARAGTLYVVATPIGNMRDLTLRALDILQTADVIAAEDTRVTAVLLRHYGIATRLLSLHAHNEAQRAQQIVALLREGKSIALVTDAGTPAVSDPGARLVRAVHDAQLPVTPIPGASAAIAAVSGAGLCAETFLVIGFLPATAKARNETLAGYRELDCALVIYEAPHRVQATIDSLVATFGNERVLVIARELTKKFETIARVPLADAAPWLRDDSNRRRGEFVLIVDVLERKKTDSTTQELTAEADRLLRVLIRELPPARAARVVAELTGASRDRLYQHALAMKPRAKQS